MAALAGTVPFAFAQRLAVRRYGVSDGLVQSQVSAVLQDSRGFYWIGTWEGLSRFDGRRFVNYGVDDGLPHPAVNSLSEDPQGRLWVATNEGLATLVDDVDAPSPPTAGARPLRFAAHRLPRGHKALAVVFEPDGRAWCLTSGGLLRGREARKGAWTFEDVLSRPEHGAEMPAAMVDRQGGFWFGVGDTLVSVAQGHVDAHAPPPAWRGGRILGLVERAPGRILAAFKEDLLEFDASRHSWRALEIDLRDNELTGPLQQDGRGVLYVGTAGGLLMLDDGSERLYTTQEGLAEDFVFALTLDRQGHLWIAHGPKGSGHGLSRLAADRIRSWTMREGLPDPSVYSIAAARDGRVYAGTEDEGLVEMSEDGVRGVPGSRTLPFRHVQRRFAQDASGAWWVGTDGGLFRFAGPGLRLDRGGRRMGRSDGFAAGPLHAFGFYADPLGAVWVSSTDGWFYRFRLGSPSPLARFTLDAGGPEAFPRTFLMDRAGTLWVAAENRFARLTEGRLAEVQPTSGLPSVQVRALLQDRKGRLWAGLRHHGLSMTEQPLAASPSWTNYSTHEGLSSNAVFCLAEDAQGRVFAGTSRGLDRLDPDRGQVRHWGAGDGLPGDVVSACATDANGHLWVALQGGVARVDLDALSGAHPAPPVYLTRVSVSGADVRLPERGTASLRGIEIPASRNDVLVEFVAPTLDDVAYQYRLQGADGEWSQPSRDASVHYARLEPGRYRLLVRAVLADGVAGEAPALLEFYVARPLWQQPWFLLLAAAVLLAIAWGVHRLRIERVLALERVRTQIARDLHDDLGSGLGSIGILAGLGADGRVDAAEQTGLARRIAEMATELGSVLSDIVWALRRDTATVEALAAHLAERGQRLFPLPPPEFKTLFPRAWPALELPLLARRNLLAIALEALHNAARHARARQVTLGLAVEASSLRLWVEDDGCGLAAEGLDDSHLGMGLPNMRRRAAEAGAAITIARRPPGGTMVEVLLPLRHR